MMEMLLAQAQQTVEQANTLLGLTVTEWLTLMAAIPAFIGAIYERMGRKKGENKLKAIIEAVEETKREHPDAVKVVKKVVQHKATQMGVQTGMFGLEEDVKKLTKHFDPDKIADLRKDSE